MDVLVTYVNGNDPLWQEDYCRAVNAPAITKRYRDWGTLKYLFRGIETCLPFVGTIHLVVSRESQVPQWVNRSTVHVVLHEEIIPQRFLPTFNSTAIEMFIHKVPGLQEQCLYFNDDTFPMLPCSEEDFFPGGLPATAFSKGLFTNGMFRAQVKNSDTLARKAAGMKPGIGYIRPQHTCSPMLRSVMEEAYAKVEQELLQTISPLRERRNCNQHFFLDYMFYTGRAVNRRISNKHLSLALTSPEKLAAFLEAPSTKLVCINDVRVNDEDAMREAMLGGFEKRFPQRSRFEI